MKKRSRRPRHAGRTASGGDDEKKGTRGRPRKTAAVPADGFYGDDAEKYSETTGGGAQQHLEGKSRSSGRLSTAVCRLCHGKFSPRSLRHAFVKFPQDSAHLAAVEEADSAATAPLLFHSDFHRLVGVPLDRDPGLSDFVCKKCHAKFYKCHNILRRFLQRVNLPAAAGARGPRTRRSVKSPESAEERSAAPASFSSDPKCLLSLVSWAHRHGEACHSCPDLKEVLEGQCWGSVRAVWGCVDGHRYTMDTRYAAAVAAADQKLSSNGEGVMSEEEEEQEEQPAAAGNQSGAAQSPPVETWSSRAEDFSGQEEAPSPSAALLEERAADSDLSDRAGSEEELEESSKGGDLEEEEEELFDPYAEKRAHRVNAASKRRRSPKAPEEPKVKKKPGPKPGWKNKFKPKGEDLPNIYKCPYQGCTAVYRAPDGLKKHIKEHHEEVRQRPCPHPGCNKVFMIDRYLQRHVKLIHTEERNYICDQCGQTFKQRKHLSVHQMRHSGAKPLQCEVCGFQCRQRASLKYHMTKHKAEADLEFECLMCRKRFEKAHNLNVHMSMVHPLTQKEAQRGGDQQAAPPPPPQQQQTQAAAAYSELHVVPLGGDGTQQEQDR